MSSDESVLGPHHTLIGRKRSQSCSAARPESPNRIDEDGLAVSALYVIDPTVGTEAPPAPQLPQAPADRVRYGWDICQPIFLADLQQTTLTAANNSILTALETGAGSLWLSRV